MSNDIVRYNNGLNTVPLRNFSPVEMDIFWAVCSKMKRKGTHEMTFSFDEFKEISKYDRREKESFYRALKATWDKMKKLNYQYEDDSYFEELLLFQRFAIDKDKEQVIIQASERFEFILNSIGTNFTRFELEIMTDLSSSYTKEIYRHLMSHRDLKTRSGAWFVKAEDFRKSLGVPKSYRMSHIDERIFEKARKEFTTPDENGKQIFSSFKVEKVKARSGNKISSFRIYFEESTKPRVPLYNFTKK